MSKPPRKKFRAQPRHPVTGERLYIVADTRRELEARLQRVRELRRDYEFGATPDATSRALRPALGKVLTAGEAWSRYVATMRPRPRARAEAVWQNHLAPWFATLRAHELNPDTMAAWLLKMRRTGGKTGHGRAPNTIWLAYDMLAAAFNRLLGAEMIALPWGRWRPGVPHGKDGILTRRACLSSFDELVRLIEAAHRADAERWTRGRYSALTATVAVLCLTGMRQAEAAALGWDMLELESPARLRVHIWYQAGRDWRAEFPGAARPPGIPKGKHKRSQVLHPSAALVLREHRAQLERLHWYREDGPVFPDVAGQWRTTGAVLRPDTMRALVRAAGLPNPHLWTTHSTRHSFATLEAQALHGDLAQLKARTGHASVAQLEGYYHPGPTLSMPALPRRLLTHAIPAAGRELTPRAPRELPPAAQPAPISTWLELARAWLELPAPPKGRNGRPLTRPPEVSARVKALALRAFKKAMKAGRTSAEAHTAGKHARASALGAWTRALRKAERERETRA